MILFCKEVVPAIPVVVRISTKNDTVTMRSYNHCDPSGIPKGVGASLAR